ncbi:MAG: PrsW family glutamic-type intramembrane protease [Treponema sp.]|nr:PrsW family glutamic-type intramembrane protease [Treponema sp.]
MSGLWVLIILILVSSLPVVIVYIWFRIIKYQLSLDLFLFALLAGAAAIFPALLLQNLFELSVIGGGRRFLFYEVFVRIAFTEELSRLLMLFIFFFITGIFKPEERLNQPVTLNTVRRGTAIGLVAGLGFAILESARIAASTMDTSLLLLRFVTAVPLHGACGSRIGSAAVLFRSNPIQALLRVITAIAIHGVYNLMIPNPGLPLIAAVLIAFSALVTTILTISSNQENSQPAS